MKKKRKYSKHIVYSVFIVAFAIILITIVGNRVEINNYCNFTKCNHSLKKEGFAIKHKTKLVKMDDLFYIDARKVIDKTNKNLDKYKINPSSLERFQVWLYNYEDQKYAEYLNSEYKTIRDSLLDEHFLYEDSKTYEKYNNISKHMYINPNKQAYGEMFIRSFKTYNDTTSTKGYKTIIQLVLKKGGHISKYKACIFTKEPFKEKAAQKIGQDRAKFITKTLWDRLKNRTY